MSYHKPPPARYTTPPAEIWMSEPELTRDQYVLIKQELLDNSNYVSLRNILQTKQEPITLDKPGIDTVHMIILTRNASSDDDNPCSYFTISKPKPNCIKCGEYNEYQNKPFTCWRCKHGA